MERTRHLSVASLLSLAAVFAVPMAGSVPTPARADTCIDGATVSAGSTGNVVCDNGSIAIGADDGFPTTADHASIAIGAEANATGEHSIAVGITSTATGTYSVATGEQANATGNNTLAIGAFSTASADWATAIGYQSSATDGEATALGTFSSASGYGATAIGSSADASGDYSSALGRSASAAGYSSTALGELSSAAGDYAIAAGRTSEASGYSAVAIGQSAKAVGDYSLASGYQAQANAVDAVAIGHSATVATGADGAVAIGSSATASGITSIAQGYSASSSGLSSVAIGRLADADADQGIAIGNQASVASGAEGGVAIGYTASASGLSSLALGRGATATNDMDVALGANSVTDTAVATTDVTINGETYNFAGTTPTSTVSVGDVGSERTITNVAAGRLSDSSTDAVNGSQLYATNQAVDALGDRAVTYDGAVGGPKNTITLEGTSGTTITNLKAGDVSSTSSDAVNGSQLYATNQNVDQNADDIADLDDRAVKYDGAVGGLKDTITLEGTAGTTITNLKAGDVSSTSSDAVNGSQLYATNQNVDQNANDIADLDDRAVKYDGAVGGLKDTITLEGTSGTTITNVADGALSATSSDAVNGSQLYATNQAIDTLTDVANNSVQYDDTGKGIVTLGGATGTTITNVKAGAVNATSKDAINGSQLYDLSSSIAANLGGGATVNANGTINGPTYSMQGGTYTNVYDTFAAVDNSLTNINNAINDINNGGGVKYFHTNSTGADSQAVGQESIAVGSGATANADGSVAMGNNATTATGADGAVAIGRGATANNANDVALGAGSVTQDVVATSGTRINGNDYDFAGTAPVGTVSIGDEGAERTITNVAAGRVTADSTDAVNGSQLYATNQAINDLASNIGELGDGAVMYDKNADGTRANSITLAGGDPNAPVVISNVAAGVADTDAVNVAQLKDGLSETLDKSKSYTDKRVTYAIDTANDYTDQVAETTLNESKEYTDYKFGQLNREIGNVRSEARQAAAIGLAAASLRYDDRPGKASFVVGGGFWRGESAFALGAGYTSENSRVRANISATTAGGNWGAGAGLSFTLN